MRCRPTLLDHPLSQYRQAGPALGQWRPAQETSDCFSESALAQDLAPTVSNAAWADKPSRIARQLCRGQLCQCPGVQPPRAATAAQGSKSAHPRGGSAAQCCRRAVPTPGHPGRRSESSAGGCPQRGRRTGCCAWRSATVPEAPQGHCPNTAFCAASAAPRGASLRRLCGATGVRVSRSRQKHVRVAPLRVLLRDQSLKMKCVCPSLAIETDPESIKARAKGALPRENGVICARTGRT